MGSIYFNDNFNYDGRLKLMAAFSLNIFYIEINRIYVNKSL